MNVVSAICEINTMAFGRKKQANTHIKKFVHHDYSMGERDAIAMLNHIEKSEMKPVTKHLY